MPTSVGCNAARCSGGQDQRYPVADIVAGLAGGALVEHHLVAAVRLCALDDAEPLQPVPGGRVGPVGAEGRRAERADHLAASVLTT